MKKQEMSRRTLKRLPFYLNYLATSFENGDGYVSSATIASALSLNEVQVRKDLSQACSTRGIPKKGFCVSDLISGLRKTLGYDIARDAILIGVGNLGRALLSYKGFAGYGLNITAAFDSDTAVVDNDMVFDISFLPQKIKELGVSIAIITVPADAAQKVCDILTDNGILAIWNFAPTHLNVPDGVLVQNENMAASFAVLSNHLNDKIMEGNNEYGAS